MTAAAMVVGFGFGACTCGTNPVGPDGGGGGNGTGGGTGGQLPDGGQCVAAGDSCDPNVPCCAGSCQGSICVGTVFAQPPGGPCTNNAQCALGNCLNGTCANSSCGATGSTCSGNGDCCSATCTLVCGNGMINGAEQCVYSARTERFYITLPGVDPADARHGVVAVINPEITTTARGRWVSDPIPVERAAGSNPRPAIRAVITTGRTRESAPK